jgi:hypothetical protein
MLAPATRYGYLIYPAVLLGAAYALRTIGQPADEEIMLEKPADALN